MNERDDDDPATGEAASPSPSPPSSHDSSFPSTSPSPSSTSPPLPPRSKTAPPPLNISPNAVTTAHIHQVEESLVIMTSTAVSPIIAAPPAMRRTSSSLSAGSSSGPGSRDKKRLRFTPLVRSNAEAGPSGTHSEDDVIFPGDSYDQAEEGRMGRRRVRGKGVPKDQAGYLMSEPGTPNLQETADQIRRTISLASLDSLILLSANQAGERQKLIKEVSRAGKELVWRSVDDKKLYPQDGERAVILAAKRGLRSFILAFLVRAGVNVLLTIFRTARKRKLRLALIRHAIFGAEPFRFGAMIGTFTFLNTLTLHLLRLAPPLSYLRRRLRVGLFNRPSFGPPEREGAEGERRWQAGVAGAVGSLALLWETKSRRTGVAQQMFVRGLQGSYNMYAPRYGIRVPHGDLLLFGLCCGQIMFAFLLSPETIPREYNSWILQASKVPEFAILANRTTVRQGLIEPEQIQRALASPTATRHSKKVMSDLLQRIQAGAGWKSTGAAPCEMVHPWCDSCVETNFRRFFDVFRWMLPVYGALHLIPALVLRRHHFARSPVRMLLRVILGITRSCSFLGAFVMIYQTLFCLRTQTLEKWAKEGLLNKLLKRKETFWFLGFSTCLSLLLEEKKRRAELAMYVLPRALESAWSSARKRAWLPIVPFGESILGAGAMAMVMDAYKHQPEALSGVVRRLLYQLVGPV